MSSTKRRRVVDGSAAAAAENSNSQPPFIPSDLLVEIFARADTKTIIRGAATCKPIRRGILGPDFHRRLAPRRAGAGRFDPALLLGVSCLFRGGDPPEVFLQEQRRPFSFDAGKLLSSYLSSYEPMVSRGCLVVLHPRSWLLSAGLRVVNCLTGHVTRIDSPGLTGAVAGVYPRALLAVGEAGRSFQLLVAGTGLLMRVFSSELGDWGDVIQAHLPPSFIRTVPNRLSPPLVIGATVHWLCKEKGIVALDTSAARATVIKLPPKCFSQVSCPKGMDKGLLASSDDGRLSLLVAEQVVISMWTLSAAAVAAEARWTRQVVIHRQAIGREGPECKVRFLQFGERSGTVMLQMERVGLIQIDLMGSGEARVIRDEFNKIGASRYPRLQLCMHETDLPTLIQSITKNMKLFFIMRFYPYLIIMFKKYQFHNCL